ncbi:MAG TPA: YcaO-like family protein, partial [Paraburkholderia sp.]|nr:YcaO-like family protein [Paraburkholderia sp.]
MQCIVPERSVSLAEAEAKIDLQLRENAVQISLERFGAPLSSTVATLDSDGFNESCRGCGKGYEDEARVGAKFEAYEHHYSLQYFRAACELMPFPTVAAQPALAGMLPVRILARNNPTRLGTIRFDDEESLPTLHYPAFLIDYNHPSNRLTGDDADYQLGKRYSCGTGLAAGVGYIEAAIHAVSEVIERHSVGCFIAQHFFYSSRQAVRVVSPDSLPDDVAQVFHDAESCLHSRIQLIDVASAIDCPVYIARCQERHIAGVHVMGAGCSIYAGHAATRAIKELVQQHHIAEGVEWVRDEWR